MSFGEPFAVAGGGRRPKSSRKGCEDTSVLKLGEDLRLATWNCGGLTGAALGLADDLGYDVLALTETHDRGKFGSDLFTGEVPDDGDRSAGVAIMLSKRTRRAVMFSGAVASRLAFVRLKGVVFNLFIIAAYIPHSGRKEPSMEEIYDELDKLLRRVPSRDCVILMGDFNSKLKRNVQGVTGRWCSIASSTMFEPAGEKSPYVKPQDNISVRSTTSVRLADGPLTRRIEVLIRKLPYP